MFPVVHTMCLLFISLHVPAVYTSVPSGAVSLFSLAPFPLAYCFFFPFSYSIRHPSLGLVIFLPYMCRAESIKGVITANFKDCQTLISVENPLRLQTTRAQLQAANSWEPNSLPGSGFCRHLLLK